MKTLLNGSAPGRKLNTMSNHGNIARFIKALLTAPMTRYEIAEFTGMHYDTVQRLLKVLKANDVVYIIDWKADDLGKKQNAVFTLGEGEDAPRPPRKTVAERTAKYKRKLKVKSEPVFQPKTQFIGGILWQ